MKHYLLTWYGITDLRAALGLEATDGPILSALKTGSFDEVVILAYTNPEKDQTAFTDTLRTNWEKWRTSDLETRLKFPRERAQQFVDAVSNTPAGHAIVEDWLKTEITAACLACNVQFIPNALKHLNDAQGIYDAAASALKLALSRSEEKTLTSYVSPGTPVMAYTWALIARANPQHDIEVISSSDSRKPPELIDLPKDLLSPVVSAKRSGQSNSFDAIIHLLGYERMPIYFGILQFQAAEHIFITTQEYRDAVNVLVQLLPRNCRFNVFVIKDPFNPGATQKAIERAVSRFRSDAKITANLTGGTKLMFAGALAACWAGGIEPFYFEIKNHNVIFIRDGAIVPFIGVKSIAEIFAVNGFEVITSGMWEDRPCRAARIDVTVKLWGSRKLLGKLYQNEEFRHYKVPRGVKRNPPFNFRWGASHASFNAEGEPVLILEGETVPMPKSDDFGQYLGGGWLEEYMFSLLRPLEEKRLIFDLRVGIEVDYAGKLRHSKDMPNGEFDCAFTDGKRLWLIECKAGAVKQEHIQKLENNLKTYGGIAARGILVSSFPIGPALVRRASSSTSIHAVHPEQLSLEFLENIISS